MIALLLALTLVQTAPQAHSAKCLIEVAASGGDDLDIRNDRMRQAATLKTDKMMDGYQSVVGLIAEYDRARAAYMATVPALIADGSLPPGSEAAIRERNQRERKDLIAPLELVRSETPSCAWPDIPAAPAP